MQVQVHSLSQKKNIQNYKKFKWAKIIKKVVGTKSSGGSKTCKNLVLRTWVVGLDFKVLGDHLGVQIYVSVC